LRGYQNETHQILVDDTMGKSAAPMGILSRWSALRAVRFQITVARDNAH